MAEIKFTVGGVEVEVRVPAAAAPAESRDIFHADGTTQEFALNNAPSNGAARVYQNGLLMCPFEDYRIDGQILRMFRAGEGDIIQVLYYVSVHA